ncbi:hypothetical protein RYA05_01775 [Pseudomonas syringae pv. actinidiae]|nr:hypothetical protein [Pseudomonas syringae pv. actinidiae]
MRYFYGEFPFSFQSFPRPTTIRFVFSTEHRQIIFAQGLDMGQYVIAGPDHFPELEAHLFSLDLYQQNFTATDFLPEFCISYFIHIQVVMDGEHFEFPLAELEADVDAELNEPDGEAETFGPEVVMGLFNAILSITGPDMNIPSAKALYADVQHRLSGKEGAHSGYQAKTLRPLIDLLKKLVLMPRQEKP